MRDTLDYIGQERLESLSSRGSDYGFYDINLNRDFEPEPTPADLCVWGKPSTKCTCSYCKEMTLRERKAQEAMERI